MARRRRAGSASRRGARTGRAKVGKVMREYKRRTLRSSSGAKVRRRKQAVAIALSEARRSGARIPRKGRAKGRRSARSR